MCKSISSQFERLKKCGLQKFLERNGDIPEIEYSRYKQETASVTLDDLLYSIDKPFDCSSVINVLGFDHVFVHVTVFASLHCFNVAVLMVSVSMWTKELVMQILCCDPHLAWHPFTDVLYMFHLVDWIVLLLSLGRRCVTSSDVCSVSTRYS